MSGYLVLLVWVLVVLGVTVLARRQWRDRAMGWTSLGRIAAGFAGLVLVGAWTWRVPLDAQGAVAGVATPVAAGGSSVDCGEVNERLTAVASASRGALAVSGSSLLLDPALWRDLPPGQRDLFVTLARELARCRSGDGLGTALIRSKDGAELLYEDPAD